MREKGSTHRINRQISTTATAVDCLIGVGKSYALPDPYHKALLGKGYIKAANFKNSKNKRAYIYRLTPAGIAAKSRATTRFLARKQAEYERLTVEIEELRREAQASNDDA